MDNSLFHKELDKRTRVIYTASDFAKSSLLYLQEAGTLQAKEMHTSKRESLSSYLFFVVNSGSGTLVYGGMDYPLSKGDCVFIDCKLPYSHTTSKDLWSISWIHFDGPTASNIYAKYLERGGKAVFRPDKNHFSQYCMNIDSIYNIAKSDSYVKDVEINALLANIITTLMADSWPLEQTKSNTKKTNMIDVKQYLEENYAKKICLDTLSEHFYINKFYLTRAFKKQFGMSIMDYLTSIRITEAKKQLRFSDRPAEEIGIKCGIGDIYYFSKLFKRVEGLSIREYRKQWQ